MKTFIIGYGEIGKSLEKTLQLYPLTIVGEEGIIKGAYDNRELEIMHICFPYSEKFISEVKKYQKKYKPKYTIVHSTVPVGTSRKLNAVHSPVIGLHPYLEKSLFTFTKFLGGEQAGEMADYFRRAGMKVYITDKQETTELMKIMDTTQYGIEIEFAKELKRECDKYEVPFEAWSLWVDNYNQGYEKLDYPEYKKPNLVPLMKKISGHCILPNVELLNNKFTKFLRDLVTKK